MPRNESDSAWKDLLDIYLKDFFDYCLPTVSVQIDWSRSWTSLDKEFQSIVKGESGKRLADKLFKVYRQDGTEQWVLIHIEVQNEPEKEFPQRMFTYHYRIYDRYQKQVKFALTKRLYDKKYSKADIVNLYHFIDWLIGLPELLELEYLDYVYQLEEAKKMPYISTAERIGLKRGIEQGIEKEKNTISQRLLAEGFEPAFIAKITNLSLSKIQELQETSDEN